MRSDFDQDSMMGDNLQKQNFHRHHNYPPSKTLYQTPIFEYRSHLIKFCGFNERARIPSLSPSWLYHGFIVVLWEKWCIFSKSRIKNLLHQTKAIFFLVFLFYRPLVSLVCPCQRYRDWREFHEIRKNRWWELKRNQNHQDSWCPENFNLRRNHRWNPSVNWCSLARISNLLDVLFLLKH